MHEPARKSDGKTHNIGDVLTTYIRSSGLEAQLEAASVIPDWDKIVEPHVAAVTRPTGISKGVLFVAVPTSVWIFEMNMRKAQLLRRINEGKSEQSRIEKIVFVMDPEAANTP